MQVQDHSTVREGIVTGVIGTLIMAVWYFVFDTASGRPLSTPRVIGKILFQGDLTPGTRAILGYTLVHFVLLALVGMGLTLLGHQATRNTTLPMGVWLGLVWPFTSSLA